MTTTVQEFLGGKVPENGDWNCLTIDLRSNPGLRMMVAGVPPHLLLRVFRESETEPIREIPVSYRIARGFGYRV